MINQQVCDLVSGHLDNPAVHLESTFDELGIDSLEFISLMLTAENRFGILIPDGERLKIGSVRELAHAIQRLKAQQ